jgi:ribosomal protein L18
MLKNKQALRRSLILQWSSLKDRRKRIKRSRLCDVRIESILLDVNKKHRVITVVISPKRPRIQMIDFQSKDKTAYVDLVSPSQEMRFFEGLFNETQTLQMKRSNVCWSNYPRSVAT